MKTLEQILIDVNSVVDLDASLPTGDELTARTNYANQAIWDAVAKVQLEEFKREYVVSISGATVPLPSDFREAHQNPQLLTSGGDWEEYELRNAENKYENSSGDKRAYILGSADQRYLIFNSCDAGATLSFMYQRYPSGFATLTDVCELSDPQYVVKKVESYVLYSRSDDRFQEAEQRAEICLANMSGRNQRGQVAGPRRTRMSFRNPLS